MVITLGVLGVWQTGVSTCRPKFFGSETWAKICGLCWQNGPDFWLIELCKSKTYHRIGIDVTGLKPLCGCLWGNIFVRCQNYVVINSSVIEDLHLHLHLSCWLLDGKRSYSCNGDPVYQISVTCNVYCSILVGQIKTCWPRKKQNIYLVILTYRIILWWNVTPVLQKDVFYNTFIVGVFAVLLFRKEAKDGEESG